MTAASIEGQGRQAGLGRRPGRGGDTSGPGRRVRAGGRRHGRRSNRRGRGGGTSGHGPPETRASGRDEQGARSAGAGRAPDRSPAAPPHSGHHHCGRNPGPVAPHRRPGSEVPTYIAPTPIQVLQVFVEQGDVLWINFWPTLMEAAGRLRGRQHGRRGARSVVRPQPARGARVLSRSRSSSTRFRSSPSPRSSCSSSGTATRPRSSSRPSSASSRPWSTWCAD